MRARRSSVGHEAAHSGSLWRTARLVAALPMAFGLACQSRGARPPLRPAQFSVAAAVVTPRAEFSARHVYVQARLSGSEPFGFLLDTSAPCTFVMPKVSQAAGLRLRGRYSFSGTEGEAAEAWRREGATIALEGVQLDVPLVVEWSFEHVEASVGHRIDGLLGWDFFERFVTEIDFEQGLVRLHDPARFVYDGPGEVLPLTFRDHRPAVPATLHVAGRAPIDTDLAIDLGAGNALHLTAGFVAEHGLDETLRTAPLPGYVGVYPPVPVAARGGYLEALDLGALRIRRPFAELSAHGQEGGDEDVGGYLGTEILRRFRVLLDYRRRRVILEPNGWVEVPFEWPRAGVGVLARGPTLREFEVAVVLPKSPGAAARLAVGDRIVAVNGRDASTFDLEELRALLGGRGVEVVLEVERAGETREARVHVPQRDPLDEAGSVGIDAPESTLP